MAPVLVVIALLLATLSPAISLWTRQEDEVSRETGYSADDRLSRRFWNDDLEACILKYCISEQNEGYMRCIRKHCPAGLVTVPREIAEKQVSTLHKHGARVICAELLCRHSSTLDDLAACLDSRCHIPESQHGAGIPSNQDGGAHATATEQEVGSVLNNVVPHGSSSGSARATSRLLLYKHFLKELCGHVMCPGLRGANHEMCVQEKCRPRFVTHEGSSYTAGIAPEGEPEPEQLVRKRGISAEYSMCVQGSCGHLGDSGRRLRCTLLHCSGR